MWRFIARHILALAASWLKPYWNAGLKPKRPSRLVEALGSLSLAACAIFAVYNLYTWASSGFVFRISRHGGTGWIIYADDPVAFVLWAGLYSLPPIVGLLLMFGQFAWKRQIRRAALRQFADGSSRPPAIVRRWNDR
jgi:hypothetical protein